MSENKTEKDVVLWMRSKGWREVRNHVGTFKTEYGGRVKVGTEGYPDFTFYRPITRGVTQMLHWEAKAPGKKPKPKQLEVMASLNHINEVAFWSDSLDSFKRQYYANFTEYLHDNA